ncbi:glycosyl hydrolase family 28-related protein [uncultured Sphingomonas sp.]|uniref:glycosyl hydrolase family 28-related protein n=1 Tax=uncultured Sphingomonas sp. TaxID=158754 RepID=UPI0025EC657E|nr:glycosyl hydrolase family 28-related protein [uncultured Sphingomonas sp.]
MKVHSLLFAAILLAPMPAAAQSTSVFLTAPDDPRAVTVRGIGDGRADDTAAIQRAIDAVAADRQSGGGGVVFLPSGRYRISRTLFLRSGVRMFGVGPTRPVLLLADHTPGYASGIGAMLSFTGEDQYRAGKPPVPPPTSVPANDAVFDATSTTFYSALANVDFEIGEGNAGAVAVRFRVAQHGFLRHIDFRLGSGFAGIYQAGNEADNLRFFGGRYGIVTEKTSPAWQFTLIDSEFTGQRDAAIREHEVDLTLVNVAIRDTPVGIEIDRGYSDSLWGKNVRFENVRDAGVVISSEQSVFTQVGFDNAIGINTPVFARFRESGRTIAGASQQWRVADFSHGLKLARVGEMGRTATDITMSPLTTVPARSAPALPLLPPVSEWANARALGARGDDRTDDTAALQRAVDKHRVVYLPTGRYRISDTLKLRPDSVLIALHPNRTQLYLPDNALRFAGVGTAKAMVESAKGGNAIVYGLGLYAGGVNPRASNIIWRAGEGSMVNDVRIHGPVIHNQGKASGGGIDPEARWDGQQASIWVTDGGGGTFNAIWTPNGLASTGFYVSDTKTPGHVYELSAEHHFKNEIVLRNVENWEFLAPQTEQEVRDGVYAVSTEFHNSRNILFANYHGYRVTRTAKPMDTAVRLVNSGDIRFRNVHVNAESAYAHCDTEGCGTFVRASKYPFENAIRDLTTGQEVREREFAKLDVPAATPRPATVAAVPATPGVTRLADGFYSIAGGAIDAQGKLYFIDRFHQRIHGWSAAEGLTTVSQASLDPVNLTIDRSGRLLILSSAGRDGTVYSIDPKAPDDVRAIPATSFRAGNAIALPVNVWANGEFADRIDQKTYAFPPLSSFFTSKTGEAKRQAYVSPDGSVAIPAFRVWNQGPDDHQGWRWSDTLDSYGLVTARMGERVTLTNASENLTYSGRVTTGGALTDLRVVAPRGGESVVRGPGGELYVANGQIWVYDKDGREIRRIDVPERPLQLLIGGKESRTLFILAHHALYAIDL